MTAVPPSKAVDRARVSKLSGVLAREILDDILSRKLQPGDRLPAEAVMGARFGVGRASLREALRILEVLGMISLRPGRGGGPIVTGISSEDYARTASFYHHVQGATIGDLLQSRMALEPAAARIVAERRSPSDIAELREVVATEKAAFAGGHDPTWTTDDIEFHHRILKLSNNPILELACSSLVDSHYERIRSLPPTPPKHRELVTEAHAAIVDAMEAGDVEGTELLMRAHVQNMIKFLGKKYPELLSEVVKWR